MKRKILAAILLTAILLGMFPVAAVGDGNDVIEISTPEDLLEMDNTIGRNYALLNDIDLSEYANWPVVTVQDFTLDGRGHKITGLRQTGGETDNFGLFHAWGDSVVIQNLDIYVDCFTCNGSSATIGALGSWISATKSEIIGCNAFIGGIDTSAAIGGDLIIAGLVGSTGGNGSLTMRQCSSNYGLVGIAAGDFYAEECWSSGNAMRYGIYTDQPILHAGGLVAECYDDVSLTNCYAVWPGTQPKSADAVVTGGLISIAPSDKNGAPPVSVVIKNCYTSYTHNYIGNQVYGDYNGGFIGYTQNVDSGNQPTISECYFDGDITPPTNIYDDGFGPTYVSAIGYPVHSHNKDFAHAITDSTKRTHAELQRQSTYGGWDFTNVWMISPDLNNGFPVLRAFYGKESGGGDPEDPENPDIPGDNYAITAPAELELRAGKTTFLEVKAEPLGFAYTLASSDPEVVEISEHSLIPKKTGSAYITATLTNHPEITAVCQVTVWEYDTAMKAVAASQLAYENPSAFQGQTVGRFATIANGAMLSEPKLWSQLDEPGCAGLYEEVLGDWTISHVRAYPSGLFALALDSPDGDMRILAFRGTEAESWGTVDLGDIAADVQMAVFNRIPQQFEDAMSFYRESGAAGREVLLTGHSLGGAAACYVSLQTGLRAELFNAANGLMLEDAYYAGGESILTRFQGNDRWNFVNHITQSDSAVSGYINGTLVNRAITYHNIDNLPSVIHDISRTAITAPPANDAHKLQSMIEYDRKAERFALSTSSPYSQGVPGVRQFEMTRVDALYAVRKLLDVAPTNELLGNTLEILDIFEGAVGEDYLKVRFLFGTSGKDTIVGNTILEQVFLYGGDGSDTMRGGCINDMLAGGGGANGMDGGPMNDQYFITGSGVQFINDCSGTDTIYLPSGVRVTSQSSRYEQGYDVLKLSSGQEIMLNRNRKAEAKFQVYSMDGFYCGSYAILPERYQRMALGLEDAGGNLTKTFEIGGNNLTLRILDSGGQELGTIDVEQETFPYYAPYGYFYYENGRVCAHLFNDAYRVELSASNMQSVSYSAIAHDADDMPVRRVSADVALQPGDVLSTQPKESAEEGFDVYLQLNGGPSEKIPLKEDDLTALGYTIAFQVTPENAAVILTDSGGNVVTPTGQNTYVLQADMRYTYQVSAPGYQTKNGAFTADRDAVITVSLEKAGGSSEGGSSGGSGGEGSRGSGGTSAEYTVRATISNNGKVSLSPTHPARGDTVTIAVTPNAGYELNELIITDSKGCTIEPTGKSGGKYTFAMPASNVSIKVSFTEIQKQSTRPFNDVASGAWYADAVEYVYEKGLMNGTGAATFSPNATITRGMIVTILYRLEGMPTVSSQSAFTDVASGSYCADAVAWASASGIANGYGNDSFGPNDYITREQMAVMLYRYAGYRGHDTRANAELSPFFDTAEISDFATEALRWAVGKGLLSGKDNGGLDPKGEASRAQAATILMRFCENVNVKQPAPYYEGLAACEVPA